MNYALAVLANLTHYIVNIKFLFTIKKIINFIFTSTTHMYQKEKENLQARLIAYWMDSGPTHAGISTSSINLSLDS